MQFSEKILKPASWLAGQGGRVLLGQLRGVLDRHISLMRNVLGKFVASVENEMGHGEGHGTVLQYDMKHGNT